MNGSLWLNLPSKDLPRAKKFFTELGFEMDKAHEAPHMVSMILGSNRVIVNLFPDELIQKFMGGQAVTDTQKSNEILFSLGTDSPAEVDALTKRALAAGATIYANPGWTDGWMYGSGFIDLDGHRWNMMFMDMTKLPK